jgi:D-alanyl-D-alanine carboxypeptidase/D-alanyl-D-alanine-endopeptidase (penicillin-binding protein 4)
MGTAQRYTFHLFLFFAHLSFGQNLDSIQWHFVNDPRISGASISLLAVDLESQDTLISYQPSLAVTTASTTKLFSTAMALEVLGPDYRFETVVFTDGRIRNGVLQGNLWIRGGGDVSLGSRYYNAEGNEFKFLELWMDSLKRLGVKKITGSVIVDGSYFGYEGTPKGWSDWDAGNYFGAFPAGINLYDNSVNYYFSTGKVGSKAKLVETFPIQPNLNLTCRIVAANIKSDNSNIQGKAYDNNRIATGKLPANKESFMVRASVADPERNFLNVLQEQFKLSEIEVLGTFETKRASKRARPDYDKLRKLIVQKGKTVKDIANLTNRKSVNFFAEGLLNGVAYKLTGSGKNSKAIEIYKKFYAPKMDTSALRLYDGSGLSRNNRISTAHFCDLLTYMTLSPMYNEFFTSLPIAGKSGTIAELCKSGAGEGRVHAKSGTMTGIKSYAGYIHTFSGRKLAFAFVVNGYSCNSSVVKSLMEVVLNELSGL